MMLPKLLLIYIARHNMPSGSYVKQQIGDTRKYVYDMDLQSAEAYVNSEYAVALTELEV